MTQQHLQPLLSGFLWGLNSSLLLIVVGLIAARHDSDGDCDPCDPRIMSLRWISTTVPIRSAK